MLSWLKCGAGGTVRNGYLELTMHPHVTPEQTPQHSPQRDAPLIEIPLGLSKGISRAEPFDMWAAQNGTAQPPEQVKTHPVLLTEKSSQKASFPILCLMARSAQPSSMPWFPGNA